MSMVILSYKFDCYMMHVAKVSDHNYKIVNRNNQFNAMWFHSLQELRAAASQIFRTVLTIHRHRRYVGVRRTLFYIAETLHENPCSVPILPYPNRGPK